MNTLGSTTPANIMPLEESYAIAMGFTGTDNTLTKGTPVKLNSDGTVEIADAGSDMPIGVVVVGGKGPYEEPKQVTVLTVFSAVVKGVSDAGITTGGLVRCTGKDGSGQLKFKTAAAGEWVTAVVIAGATNTNPVTVGILRSPYIVPVPAA